MPFRPSIPYPENETPKLDQLEQLFREWQQHFELNQERLPKHQADDMVFDGFYPHYFRQKSRILFIGWESVDIGGCHYMDILHKCYRETKQIGDRHLNQSQFHYLMFYLSYGILNGFPVWQAIPDASHIGDTFASPTGLSFAFMNLSKLSNERWQADHSVISEAFELSIQPRNFIREEIAILEPHVIITMNIGNKLARLGQLTPIHASVHSQAYWFENIPKRPLLINTWHFSAHKTNIESFYLPIWEAFRHAGLTRANRPALVSHS